MAVTVHWKTSQMRLMRWILKRILPEWKDKLAERAGGKTDAKIHAAENTIKATLSNVERVALLNEILCGYWFADFVVTG